jgi:hypothetical protein
MMIIIFAIFIGLLAASGAVLYALFPGIFP